MKTTIRVISMILTYVMFLPTLSAICGTDVDASATYDMPLIVTMGDSYSSGEGNEPFYDEDLPMVYKVESQDWLAHRSKIAWAGLMAFGEGDEEISCNEAKNDRWFFVAASGATTHDMFYYQKKTYQRVETNPWSAKTKYLDPQLDVFTDYDLYGKVDYVTITLGGNDVGFADIIIEAAAQNFDLINPNRLSKRLNKAWEKFEAETYNDLKLAYFRIQKAAGDQAKILVIGYPPLLNDETGSKFFSTAEALQVNLSVRDFNQGIQDAIEDCASLNIVFISIYDEFNDHEAYTKDAYINGIMTTQAEDLDVVGFLSPLISAYSIHPNSKGQKKIAEIVQAYIDADYDGHSFAQDESVLTEETADPSVGTTKELCNYQLQSYSTYDETGVKYTWGKYEYDASGNLIKATTYYFADTSEEGGYWVDQYDSYPVGSDGTVCYLNEYEYDESNNLTKETYYSPDGNPDIIYEYEYDDYGHMTKETCYFWGELSEWTEYEYDGCGNLIKESCYDSDGALNWYPTVYEYDNKGNLVKSGDCYDEGLYDEWNVYEYNDNGYLSRRIWYHSSVLDLEAYEYDDDGNIYSGWEQYEYDESGNIISDTWVWVDGVGTWTEYEYDSKNNMTRKTEYYSDGTINWYVEYEYDEAGNLIKDIAYNQDGSISCWTEYEYIIIDSADTDSSGPDALNYYYPFPDWYEMNKVVVYDNMVCYARDFTILADDQSIPRVWLFVFDENGYVTDEYVWDLCPDEASAGDISSWISDTSNACWSGSVVAYKDHTVELDVILDETGYISYNSISMQTVIDYLDGALWGNEPDCEVVYK